MSSFFASHIRLANIIVNLSDMRFLLAGGMVCLLAACGSGGGGEGSRLASEDGSAPSASFTPASLTPASPPSLSLSASPETVAPGESSVLTWDSTAADECTASGAWAGSRAISGSEVVANLTESQVYALSCSGSGGSTFRDVQITVQQTGAIVVSASHPPVSEPPAPPPQTPAPQTPDPQASAPLLSLSASPATIAAGESSTLSWGSTGASECTASGAWGGSRPTSGSEVLANVTETRVYSLSCTGSGGSTFRDVQITVEQRGEVAVSLQASATEVRVGAQIDLTWSSENAEQCSASGDWSGSQLLQGTHTTASLSGDATFRLTCTGGGNSAVGIVTVTVVDETIRWAAPAQNVDGTPLLDLDGFNVYWGTASGRYSDSMRVAADARQWRAQLPAGTYFLAVTALNSRGEESGYSNEIVKRLP